MKEYKVYKITCLKNNKVYIGQTYETLDRRLKRHFDFAKLETDTKIYRAIRKYGNENFKIELIEICKNQNELDEREFFWINYYNSCVLGYNTKNSKGKCGGDTLTNHPNITEIRRKLSKSKMGSKNPNSHKVKCLNVNTKEELFFNSIKECQNYLNIPRHDIICRRCNKKISCLYNNEWTFAYQENEYYYKT